MFETQRLSLRTLRESDIEAVYAMRSDEEVMRFIREPQKRSETADWIRLVSSRWTKEKIGFCAIIEKKTGKFAGWCGLWKLRETDEIEIGYAVAKEFWGENYAAEAAEAFLKYGFEHLNFEKIVAVAVPENNHSRRVMEKIGMHFDYAGQFYDRELVHYSITKNQFAIRNEAQI